MEKKFEWNLAELSSNQKKIADFIEKNSARMPLLTEQDIATELQISIASVSRFWKAVGYKNLKDFKLALMEERDVSPANKMRNMLNKVEADDLPGNMMELGVQYLNETAAELSREHFQLAVEAINAARHLYVYAPGPSEGLGSLLRFRLMRFGYAIQSLPKSGRELYEYLPLLQQGDVVIIFGFVNMNQEIKVLLERAKSIGCTSILITDVLVSDMLANADLSLYAFRGQMWEFHSMVAPTALVESLIVAVGMNNKEATLKNLEQFNALRKQYSAYLPK
ncbi:MurR/RpiR family transcriptional regulator [Paenibacillus sp. RC67]|uniref:MurR/RpiR family transcriptional regulator n=1 Tax=Paenibacillus sp. RC67 TaxID=3039392 RepID=UPI0024AD4A78|nr:MurR/RpiR family transcriptional regulator [Paenibacillus sp. RC67]